MRIFSSVWDIELNEPSARICRHSVESSAKFSPPQRNLRSGLS